MKKFRSKVENGKIASEIPLAEYLASLYTDPVRSLARLMQRTAPLEDEDIIEEAELNMARKKLSRNKAIGVDLLADKQFHNDILWDEMKDKVLLSFNNWVSTL